MHQLSCRFSFAIAGVSALLLAAGCGQNTGGRDRAGALGFGLQLSPGGTVSSATYTISGPNDFESAGAVPIGDTNDVPVTVSHLPIGNGYEMDLSATASDGVTTCDGTATFDVIDANPLVVVVHLVCSVPSGDLKISGSVNICPMLDSLGASPNTAKLGGFATLTSSAHDSDNGPGPLSYTWTANGAALRQRSPNFSFACSSVGVVALAVTVSDGDPNPSCADTLTVNVQCTE